MQTLVASGREPEDYSLFHIVEFVLDSEPTLLLDALTRTEANYPPEWEKTYEEALQIAEFVILADATQPTGWDNFLADNHLFAISEDDDEGFNPAIHLAPILPPSIPSSPSSSHDTSEIYIPWSPHEPSSVKSYSSWSLIDESQESYTPLSPQSKAFVIMEHMGEETASKRRKIEQEEAKFAWNGPIHWAGEPER